MKRYREFEQKEMIEEKPGVHGDREAGRENHCKDWKFSVFAGHRIQGLSLHS